MTYYTTYQAFWTTEDVGMLKAGISNGGRIYDRGEFLFPAQWDSYGNVLVITHCHISQA